MNYYNEIKNKIIDNEVYEKVAPLLQQLSWSHYAELLSIKDENKIIDNEVYEKVSPLVTQLYTIFSNKKVHPLGSQLSWSYYTELLSIKDENKNFYYIKLASTNNDTTIKKENKNELL